ncbi:MAG: GAF domain-containing protein, partial [Chloroflexi bacterium]
PSEAAFFDPELDGLEAPSGYTLLAAPLHYHHTAIGVLYLYAPPSAPFQPPDIALLESIARLTASAVIQARLREQTLHYAQQHQTLYEMSQQLTADLDVPVTLRRALQWSARLTGAEWGLLWLGQIGPADRPFRLAASMGLDLPPDRDICLCPAEDIGAAAVKSRQVHIFNRLEGDVHHDPHLRPLLTPAPRNLLAAPIIYQEQTIGLLELFDKSGGPFTPEDRSILTLALKMVSLAVGNAYLYTQTVQLLRERERLHTYLAQSERLATIGRLTAVLSHEINNPMQAIQGALLLAQEEIHRPDEVQTYLNVGLEEAQRVIDLLERLRLIYRPEIGRPERLDIGQILQTALQLARKELKQKKITLTADLPPNLPPTIAVPGQLQLVFLSLLLNLEAAADPDRGQIHIHGQTVGQEIVVTLTAEPVAAAGSPAVFTLEPASPALETNLSLGLVFSRDIIVSHGGRLEIEQTNGQVTCTVRLPVVR